MDHAFRRRFRDRGRLTVGRTVCFEELNMATWKRLTDFGKSRIAVDLDAIAFMYFNGSGAEIHFNSGQTLTVRESPEAVAKRRSPPRHKRYRANFDLHQ